MLQQRPGERDDGVAADRRIKPAVLAEPRHGATIEAGRTGGQQIGAQSGQQRFGGQHPAMQQDVRLGALGYPLARYRVNGQPVAFQDRHLVAVTSESYGAEEPRQAGSDHYRRASAAHPDHHLPRLVDQPTSLVQPNSRSHSLTVILSPTPNQLAGIR